MSTKTKIDIKFDQFELALFKKRKNQIDLDDPKFHQIGQNKMVKFTFFLGYHRKLESDSIMSLKLISENLPH